MTIKKTISVAIFGKPNAGKSTLLNNIIGKKISIVSPKAQTTRSNITGILTRNDTQFIFYDTAGLYAVKSNLQKQMMNDVHKAIRFCTILLFVVDSAKKIIIDDYTNSILRKIASLKSQVFLVSNKIDISNNFADYNHNIILQKIDIVKTFKISALKGKKIESLLNHLEDYAEEQEWVYLQSQNTTISTVFLGNEITREQLFFALHCEIPYNLMVQNELWDESEDRIIIHQSIIVSSESHKKIVIGKKGQKIKEIGIKARENLTNLMHKKIHLFLFVKVRSNWQDKQNIISIT